MTYIQKSNRQNNESRKYLWVVGLVLVVFIFSTTSFFGSVAGVITKPFFAEGESLNKNFSLLALVFGDKSALAERVQNLEAELEVARAKEADFAAVNTENERLRQELQMKPRGAMLHASIIARAPQIPLDALLLNIGSVDGVKINDLVFASDRSVVGKISKVTRETSNVLLNSSPLMSLDGFIARTGSTVEIKGAGGNSLEAQVPLDYDVVVGDTVVISHTSDNVVGIVGAIEEDKVVGSRKLLLSLPVSLNSIKSVFVLPTPSQ